MKLLMIGASESWSLETFYLKYLRGVEGLEVDILSTSVFAKQYYRKYVDRLLIRLWPNKNPYYSRFNAYLLETIQQNKPEAILVFKGMEIYPETLQTLKAWGIFLANYNPDHPFIIYLRGSGNKNVTQSVPCYDLHFCYTKTVVEKIVTELQIPAVFLPFGYELSEEAYQQIEKEEEVNRICFIGNPDPIRVGVIKFLLQNKLEVDIYGHHWNQFFDSDVKGLRVFDAVYGNVFWNTARRYRVQLNIFRPHNVGSHNMRTFEIPAAGGIMLAPDSPEHQCFFEANREVFLYRDQVELLAQAQVLLALSKEKAEVIRSAARQRSLNDYNDYQSRAMIVAESIHASLRLYKPV